MKSSLVSRLSSRVLIPTFYFLLSTFFFSGCCSYVNLDKDIPEGTIVEGEQPLATFFVQNISYQILGFIPWCSGDNWVENDIPLEDANNWRISWFCDNVSLDNNIGTLERACKEVGSYRIASISHTINEDALWSFLVVNRKTLKTSCFIMPPKKK